MIEFITGLNDISDKSTYIDWIMPDYEMGNSRSIERFSNMSGVYRFVNPKTFQNEHFRVNAVESFQEIDFLKENYFS